MNLYFDIETGLLPNAAAIALEREGDYEPYSEEGLKIGPRDRIPPEEKRAQHLAEYNEKRDKYHALLLEKGATKPWLSRIMTVQILQPVTEGPRECPELHYWCILPEGGLPEGVKSLCYDSEEEMIDAVLRRLADSASDNGSLWHWPGHNRSQGSFDMKMLTRRARALEVPVPYIDSRQVKNLCERFCTPWEDWGTYLGLEKAAREIGIDVETFEAATGVEIAGKNFADCFLSENGDTVRAAIGYAVQDVLLLEKIHRAIT